MRTLYHQWSASNTRKGSNMLPAQCQDNLDPRCQCAWRGYGSLIQFYTFPRFDKTVPFTSKILTDRSLWTLVLDWFGSLQCDTGTGGRGRRISGQVKKKVLRMHWRYTKWTCAIACGKIRGIYPLAEAVSSMVLNTIFQISMEILWNTYFTISLFLMSFYT